MKKFIEGRVLISAVGAFAVVALLAGCGGGSKEPTVANEEKGNVERRPPAGSADAEKRHVCLEARESSGIPLATRNTCREVGVTQGSPPPSSPEAQEAAKKAAGRPMNERVRRSAALEHLDEGNRSRARSELEEGCPKSDPEELSEAWRGLQELRRLIHTNPELSEARIVERLNELCLL